MYYSLFLRKFYLSQPCTILVIVIVIVIIVISSTCSSSSSSSSSRSGSRSCSCSCSRSSREFKKRQRLRQRQRQKAVILLVEKTKMIVLLVRHAFLNISLPYSSKLLREITKFDVLTTTWTNYSESFSLVLYFKSVRTNPVIGHFGHIV